MRRQRGVACHVPRTPFEVRLAESRAQRSSLQGSYVVGLCLFLVVAVFFLWQEHRAHLFGLLPYALLLLCPFIHLFTHRGHSDNADARDGGHDHGDHRV